MISETRRDEIGQFVERFGMDAAKLEFPDLRKKTLQRYRNLYRAAGGVDNIEIKGVMPESSGGDPEEILARFIKEQEKVADKIDRRYSQEIKINDNKPVLLALFSDIHLGNQNCDYKQFKCDVELAAKTDGVYAFGIGDYVDNWVGKLEGIQRKQPMSFDDEMRLMEWFFETLGDSLIGVLSGNHEARTPIIAGIDYLKTILRGRKILYDSDEILFTLKLGDKASWRIKTRHKWKGSSKYNETHPMESEIKFGDYLFDIGIGGHTHNGTLMRPFHQYGKKVYAVLLGTYLMFDKYATQLGFPNRTLPSNSGCGGLMLYPDGNLQHWDTLEKGVEYLEYVRGRE